MTGSSDDDHAVGYGKPPRLTRFKRGQSGNPKGRPRGVRNFKTELREALNAPVNVTTDGKEHRVSTSKASLLRLRQKALAGDARALDRIITLAQRADEDEEARKVSTVATLSAEDAQLIELFRQRVLRDAAEVELKPENGADR